MDDAIKAVCERIVEKAKDAGVDDLVKLGDAIGKMQGDQGGIYKHDAENRNVTEYKGGYEVTNVNAIEKRDGTGFVRGPETAAP